MACVGLDPNCVVPIAPGLIVGSPVYFTGRDVNGCEHWYVFSGGGGGGGVTPAAACVAIQTFATGAPSVGPFLGDDCLYHALDGDLQQIAALTPSNDDILQRKAGTWVNRTIAQYKADLNYATVASSGSASDLSTGTLPDARLSVNVTLVDGSRPFTSPVAGVVPTLAAHLATKGYADSLVVGLLDDRGNYDASVNTFPASGGSGSAGAILKGDLWTISVAGTLGGVAVTAGDLARALVDAPGQTTGNWAISETNIGYVALNATLNDGQIYIGNNSNVATARTLSGDLTVSNLGVTAIGLAKVTSVMLNADVFSTAHSWSGQQTFVAPILGTPASGILTNATGLPVATGISGLGVGVAGALAISVGSAGAFVVFNGAGGAPSSLTLTNATGLPPVTGIVGWPANATGVLTNNGSGTLSWVVGGGASAPFDDATAIVKGSADPSKLLRIEVDGLTTAVTRVWTAPNSNLTVAGIDLAQTFSAAQSFSSTITQTSASATAFQSGPNGPTNPVFELNNSVTSAVTGLRITGNAAGAGVTLTAISSAASERITLIPKTASNIGIVRFQTFSATDYWQFTGGSLTYSKNAVGEAIRIIGDDGGGTGPAYVWLGANGFIAWNSLNRTDSGATDVALARHAPGVIRVAGAHSSGFYPGSGSLVIGTSTVGNVGAGGVGVFAAANGTAPSSSPVDTSQFYSADWNGAGTAAWHSRNEEGHIIKLCSQAVAVFTNNVTAGGTNDQTDTWSDLTTYANDATAIRNAIYQLSRKLAEVVTTQRTNGLFR